MPAATVTRTAAAVIHHGAAMARCVFRCSTSRPSAEPNGTVASVSSTVGQRLQAVSPISNYVD
jgi:hypothetical protein